MDIEHETWNMKHETQWWKFRGTQIRQQPTIKRKHYLITPTGKPIKVKSEEVKDFGVLISDDNKFDKQISSVIKKAKDMAS